MRNPFTPLDAASIAAYSNLRVESEVQYWTVAGGGGAMVVSSSSSTSDGFRGSLKVGNWKN
jgi:hypothetical protein